MLTATLGGLIKDFRIRKRLSQLEVSLRIGWSDTTRLSKIEQGRVGTPTRQTLNKIMDALDLNYKERADMFIAANIMPTPEDAQNVLKKLEKNIQEFSSPVILVDFAWNVYYFNQAAKELFQLSEKDYQYIVKNHPNWMEAHFLTDMFDKVEVKAGYTKDNLLPFKEYLVAHFKYEQAGNFDEKWFKGLLARLSKDEEFRRLWAEIPASKEDHLYDYEINQFEAEMDGKKQAILYSVYGVSVAFDFRFAFLIHQPD